MKVYTVQGSKMFGGIERKAGPFRDRRLAEQAAVEMAKLIAYAEIVESVEEDDEGDES